MKIAFLFLIYDIINQEELWHLFFKDIDPNKFSIYIHYKTNKPLKYFEKYKISNCIPTKWGHVSLIHAHNLLFKTALLDTKNYKFINISQACIPLKSFDHIYDFLIKDDLAHFNDMGGSCFPRCNSLLQYIPASNIKKMSEWFILNRNLALIFSLIDINYINKLYGNIFAPDEHFFITYILDNKYNNQVVIHSQNINSTTFTNWGDKEYKYKNGNHLAGRIKLYNTIFSEELKYLINSLSLFARKFSNGYINLDILKLSLQSASKPTEHTIYR